MTCSCINNYTMICNLHMQLILVINVDFDENENEKYTYIIHFECHPKIDENVIVCLIWIVNV